jgi:hypothetical protein
MTSMCEYSTRMNNLLPLLLLVILSWSFLVSTPVQWVQWGDKINTIVK